MKTRFLLIILSVAMMMSCQIGKGIVEDNGFYITISDNEGKDLLNPENPNRIDLSKVKIFQIVNNGEKIELTKPSEPFKGFSNSDYYRLGYYINPNTDGKRKLDTEIIIFWNELNTDTIKATFMQSRYEHVRVIEKLYLNGEMKWEESTATPYRELRITLK